MTSNQYKKEGIGNFMYIPYYSGLESGQIKSSRINNDCNA